MSRWQGAHAAEFAAANAGANPAIAKTRDGAAARSTSQHCRKRSAACGGLRSRTPGIQTVSGFSRELAPGLPARRRMPVRPLRFQKAERVKHVIADTGPRITGTPICTPSLIEKAVDYGAAAHEALRAGFEHRAHAGKFGRARDHVE